MHLVQFISHYVPAVRYGGPQQVAHGLGKALAAAGHRVSVCTTNLQDERTDLTVKTLEPIDVDGVTVYYHPTQFSRYWGYAPHLGTTARRLISEADAVLVHFHYQYANWIGARWARCLRKPYMLFAHGSFKRDAIRRKSRWVKSLYLATMERRNVAEARNILFNADEERDRSWFRERGCVLPNAIDPNDFMERPARGTFRKTYGIPASSALLLFLGRMDVHGKGLDLLLPAFAQLAVMHPEVSLVLAGPDERAGTSAVQRMAASFRIQDRLVLPGMLRGTEKLSALNDADIFVLPSRSEGLSIALLEALYLGIPVLITHGVGLHRQVADWGAGMVVEPTVPDLLRGLRYLADPQHRLAMRNSATPHIEQFHTWPVVADQFLELLQPHLHGDESATCSSGRLS